MSAAPPRPSWAPPTLAPAGSLPLPLDCADADADRRFDVRIRILGAAHLPPGDPLWGPLGLSLIHI